MSKAGTRLGAAPATSVRARWLTTPEELTYIPPDDIALVLQLPV